MFPSRCQSAIYNIGFLCLKHIGQYLAQNRSLKMLFLLPSFPLSSLLMADGFSVLYPLLCALPMFLLWEAEYIFPPYWHWACPSWFYLGHVTCPGSWRISRHDMSRGLKCVFMVELALSLFCVCFLPREQHVSKSCWAKEGGKLVESPEPSLQVGVKSSWTQPSSAEPRLIFRGRNTCLWS